MIKVQTLRRIEKSGDHVLVNMIDASSAGTKMAQPFVWFPSSPHLTNHFLRHMTSGLLAKTVAPAWVKTFIVVQP